VALAGVAVRGAADVPPVHGVLAEPFPRGFLDLQPVPLGDGLLDAADEDGGGVHPLDADGLVGGEQQDALVGELALQLEGVERVAARPFDVLADDGRPVSACSQESECPRSSMSRPPDSMSQKCAAR
jgi:hypothetical protein